MSASESTPTDCFPPPAELPSLAEFARRLTVAPRRASAGATAALAVAIAADLVAQVAERSHGWNEHQGALAQADVVRDRATALAREVAIAYHPLVVALDGAVADSGSSLDPGPAADLRPSSDAAALGRQLGSAADLLLDIAGVACDCASLAVVVAKAGDTVVRADATAAAALAACGAEMAAHLAQINLLASTQPERTVRAYQLASAAAEDRNVALKILR